MNKNINLYYCSLVAAFSGFLFGFDAVVISGAEQRIQEIWQLSSFMHGLTISTALWGTVLGSMLGHIPTERWGRKNVLIAVGILYLFSAIGSAMANDVILLITFRFIGGLGIGISTIVAPLYITEISPPEKRGHLTGMFQLNIVLGVLMAYVSNALLANTGNESWRLMLGIQAIPSFFYILFCFKIPESPRWLLIKKNDPGKAKNIMTQLNISDKNLELSIINNEFDNKENQIKKSLYSNKKLRKPIFLAIFIAVFNQLSGINAILYFAPRIFELSGLGQSTALLQSVGIGLVNLIFTFLGLWLIDKAGRKKLLTWGALGYIISLGACSFSFAYEQFQLVPYCIFLFIASHAIGQGAVIWVFIAEIFPNQYRDSGQALGSFTHWIIAALLTLIFPKAVELVSPSLIFATFCFLMIIQLLWIVIWVPETKGIPLEEIEKQFNRSSSTD